MRLSTILDPIDARAFMPEKEASDSGIRISNSAVAILLFLFAQTVGAVWWASSANEKLNNVNANLAAQSAAANQQRSADIERVKSLEDEVKGLHTYNQHTREQFALHGWIIDGDGNLSSPRRK